MALAFIAEVNYGEAHPDDGQHGADELDRIGKALHHDGE
jgi:hypothetical protein